MAIIFLLLHSLEEIKRRLRIIIFACIEQRLDQELWYLYCLSLTSKWEIEERADLKCNRRLIFHLSRGKHFPMQGQARKM